MGGVFGTLASYALDPMNIAGTRGNGSHSSEPESVGSSVPYTPAEVNFPQEPTKSPMGYQWLWENSPASKAVGQAFQFGKADAGPPPPQAHWSYDPHGGTTWQTPDKRLTADNQYSWNTTAPGVAPGNRI